MASITEGSMNASHLVSVLAEFYGAQTTPARKAEIDQLLGHFKQQPDSWRHCQQYLSSSGQLAGSLEGQYLLFFSVLVFEEFVRRKWVEAAKSDRDLIRAFLFQYLTVSGPALPQFISTKLAASVAKPVHTPFLIKFLS